MKIVKLELYRYKRVKLSNIEHLVYTPESNIQIILAANGSGKSSLMSQLSPLPADMKDFEEDGYKKITMEHNESIYELHNGVNGKTKHNFIKNGVELNDGNTKRVQLELVKQHFKLTPQIHNILLGFNNFTSMSPSERKKWLTEISDIDYSYSIKFYNDTKSRHRDVVGGIKLLQENIVRSEDLLLSKEAIAKKNEDITQLNKFIDYLLSLTKHNVGDYSGNKELLDNIKNTNREATALLTTVNNMETMDTQVINSKIGGLTNAIDTIKTSITAITTELNNYNLNKKHSKDKDDLLNAAANIKNKQTELKAQLTKLKDVDNIELTVTLWNSVYMDLIGTVTALKELSGINVTPDNMKAMRAKYNELVNVTNRIENKIKPLAADDKYFELHMKEDNNVTCPKCNNSWYLNYDLDKHKLIKSELKILLEKQTVNKENISKLETEMVVMDSKLKSIASLRDILRSSNGITSIWKELLDGLDIHTDGVIELDIRIEYVHVEMGTLTTLDTVNKKLLEVTNNLDKITAVDQALIANNETAIVGKENTLITLKEQLTKHEATLVEYNNYKSKLTNIKNTYDKLKSGLITFDRTRNKYIDSYRNKYLLELVNGFKSKLLELEEDIRSSNNIISKLDGDRAQLVNYVSREKVLKLMMKELSPTEGLIAKSINSFIHKLVVGINNVISSIWSYKLELLPPEVESGGDLDYKFKVRIDNGDIINDISLGSSGMKEIFDLAFKIVFMKFLGIEDLPLTLDEFGKTFDHQHQIKAYDTVDKILTSSFSQIFIISHFQSMYGRFVNADITVLNSDNVELATINDNYNKVFKSS